MGRAASKSAIQTTTNEMEIISTAQSTYPSSLAIHGILYEKEWKLGWSRMPKERSTLQIRKLEAYLTRRKEKFG